MFNWKSIMELFYQGKSIVTLAINLMTRQTKNPNETK